MLLFACSGNETTIEPTRDAGTPARDGGTEVRDGGETVRDAGETPRDGGPARDGGPGRDAGPRDGGSATSCPTAADYVGDSNWMGQITVPAGFSLCRYPHMFESMESAVLRKRRIDIPAGTYALPLDVMGAAFRMPMCYADDPTVAIGEGTVDAELVDGDFNDPARRYHITATMPGSDGPDVVFTTRLDPMALTLDLSTPTMVFNQINAYRCVSESCFMPEDDFFYRCDLGSRMCDELTFEGGSITIDQFHWSGSVGAGFATPARVRGTFRGQNFDITSYDQLTLAYGHHAFNRALLVEFDAPIDGVCALNFAEVTEFGQLDPVELLDCAGNVTGTAAITADSHLFGQPCPP